MKGNLVLNSRDKRLLEVIRDHLFLPSDVAQQYLFGSTTRRGFDRRKKQLIDHGLIRSERLSISTRRTILTLTKRGFDLAQQGFPIDLPKNQTIDLRSMEHDNLVIQTRFRLLEFWDAVWLPERTLKSERLSRIPDGIIKFDSGKMIAVELENTPKGPKRFNEIQRSWISTEFDLVLYVAASQGLFESIKDYLRTGPKDDLFGLISFPDLVKGKPKVWSPGHVSDLLSKAKL